MSDFGDAIGTAIEGSLYSKAVAGSDKDGTPLEKGHFAEGACLNCGTELVGAHCHVCGQKAHLHRTMGAFLHDLLHGALHFEGKTWKTLPMLAFKPGQLTRRYIEGERARFVSPMALFLFSIFLMFAVFQFAGISTPTDFSGDTTAKLRDAAAAEVERLEAQRVELSEELAQPDLGDDEREQLELRLEETDQALAGISEASEAVPALKELIEAGESEGPTSEILVGGIPVETDAEGNTSIPISADGNAKMNIGTSDIEWLDSALGKWRSNPTLMLYKLQTNFYKFSWLLIPLSIPFVWLLFAWKRRFKAYDHAIFVTYSLSFMTLLILTITLLGLGGAHEIFIVFGSLLIPPIHIYKHLRGAYGLSRFSALWRLVVLSTFIVIVLALFLQLLLLIGAF